uniref:RING-type domain-containing protein n=1 Tax=Parastrongyloides trichosuri TaxID=131310 RepID=A0A0N4Z9A3_PARTI
MSFNTDCFVCLQKMSPDNIIAISCGHMLCKDCFNTMYNVRRQEKKCGKCRRPFIFCIKLYFEPSTDDSNIENEENNVTSSKNPNILLDNLKRSQCYQEILLEELKKKQKEIFDKELKILEKESEIRVLQKEVDNYRHSHLLQNARITKLKNELLDYAAIESQLNGIMNQIDGTLNTITSTETATTN